MTNRSLVVLALILSLVFSSTAVSAKQSPEEQFDSLSLAQRDAIEAYNAIATLFCYTDEEIVYPDDYAGSWVSENALIIALTSYDSLEQYKQVLEDCTSYMFEIKKYSLNHLNQMKEEVVAFIREAILNNEITSWYVDQTNNCIVIESLYPEALRTSFQQEIKAKLPSFDNYDYSGTESDIDMLICFELGSYGIDESSLYGGKGICDEYLSGFTLGLCGTVYYNGNSYQGFITTGHVSGSSYYDPNENYTQIGTRKYRRYGDNYYGDYAVAEASSSVSLNNLVHLYSGYGNITGTQLTLPVGSYVMKYGISTGYSYIEVKATSVSYTYSGITTKGLVKGEIVSGNSLNGDSGGPYYIANSTGYSFCGIHKASDYTNNIHYVYYTPYTYIVSYFIPYTS